MQYADLYSQNKLSPQMLRAIGFQEAPISSLPYHLLHTQPTQKSSCLRDAVLAAMQNYYRLQRVLSDAGTIHKWKFYHIILCTLPDKISKINKKELLLEIVKLNSMWRCSSFKTFFIPIGMGDQDFQEIMNICQVGGMNWFACPTTFSDFHQQFKYVMSEIGLVGRESLLASQNSEPEFIRPTEKCSLAVTLSIEASETMKGPNWQSLINTVSFYMRNFGYQDIVSGIIFSANPWIITLRLPQQSQQQQQRQPVQYQPEVMNREQGQRAQPQQQYVLLVQDPQRNNCGRKFGRCCIVVTIILVVRFMFYIVATSS